jgi:hypothetical protein
MLIYQGFESCLSTEITSEFWRVKCENWVWCGNRCARPTSAKIFAFFSVNQPPPIYYKNILNNGKEYTHNIHSRYYVRLTIKLIPIDQKGTPTNSTPPRKLA